MRSAALPISPSSRGFRIGSPGSPSARETAALLSSTCAPESRPFELVSDMTRKAVATRSAASSSSRPHSFLVATGRRVWETCLGQARHSSVPLPTAGLLPALERSPRYGDPRLVQPRLGQATFRIAVLDAYGRACAVTGEHSLPALEAAHIRSYAQDGPHEVRNGLLLRADLHRLFDTGYVTVTPGLRLEVGGAPARGLQERPELLPPSRNGAAVAARRASSGPGVPGMAQRAHFPRIIEAVNVESPV